MSLNSGGRRVVVTGMGIVSCIGNDLDSVAASLREGRSGISHLLVGSVAESVVRHAPCPVLVVRQ